MSNAVESLLTHYESGRLRRHLFANRSGRQRSAEQRLQRPILGPARGAALGGRTARLHFGFRVRLLQRAKGSPQSGDVVVEGGR